MNIHDPRVIDLNKTTLLFHIPSVKIKRIDAQKLVFDLTARAIQNLNTVVAAGLPVPTGIRPAVMFPYLRRWLVIDLYFEVRDQKLVIPDFDSSLARIERQLRQYDN